MYSRPDSVALARVGRVRGSPFEETNQGLTVLISDLKCNLSECTAEIGRQAACAP